MPITADDVTYTYMKGSPFEKDALKNVSLEIKDGEFLAIIGHTGSGKSTLVQHFNGLIKPSAGKVCINGIDTRGKELKELRRHVGMVFQYPEHQLFEETVYKDIAFGLEKQGFTEGEIEKLVKEAVSTVGIDLSILDKSPFELSGGQKRRVAIAGVVAMKPSILILDEPTAGLDPQGRDEVFQFISRMHRQLNITIILVSHSMEDVARLAQRIIVMSDGKIHMQGSAGEIFRDVAELEKIGLSAPQITHLMKKLKAVVPYLNDNIFTVQEAKREILRYLKK
ncbi:energy-coupling factor transport system ATP-binding protein [Anaerobacterium chartisolvens]|uniref:Energy-coupling factor transporter ATP-binding protein EcfA2 n=1 Tax=Anaerobacterium chartisolvens TaxID=1297424 RepID=A0A369ATR4_9FIRM|nr:energy-coupling factor transporter ATPase [Anaerobacterium chartisolvens]RCX12762.1 energy-coupling factor transport system ATP-binding protein [Anaerobacterium chartisolvens]